MVHALCQPARGPMRQPVGQCHTRRAGSELRCGLVEVGGFKESIMCRVLTLRSFFRESRSGLTGAATARCLLPQCAIAPDRPAGCVGRSAAATAGSVAADEHGGRRQEVMLGCAWVQVRWQVRNGTLYLWGADGLAQASAARPQEYSEPSRRCEPQQRAAFPWRLRVPD